MIPILLFFSMEHNLDPLVIIYVMGFWFFVVQRTEVLGLSLAAFSVAVPYLGKFLKVLIIYYKCSLDMSNSLTHASINIMIMNS